MGRTRTSPRNKALTIKALHGETLALLSIEYGISSARVRQIIFSTVRKHAFTFYEKTPSRGGGLEYLRKKKEKIIPLIEEQNK